MWEKFKATLMDFGHCYQWRVCWSIVVVIKHTCQLSTSFTFDFLCRQSTMTTTSESQNTNAMTFQAEGFDFAYFGVGDVTCFYCFNLFWFSFKVVESCFVHCNKSFEKQTAWDSPWRDSLFEVSDRLSIVLRPIKQKPWTFLKYLSEWNALAPMRFPLSWLSVAVSLFSHPWLYPGLTVLCQVLRTEQLDQDGAYFQCLFGHN